MAFQGYSLYQPVRVTKASTKRISKLSLYCTLFSHLLGGRGKQIISNRWKAEVDYVNKCKKVFGKIQQQTIDTLSKLGTERNYPYLTNYV